MNYDYIEKRIELKDVIKDSMVEPCLLENNEKQLAQFCDFLQDDKKLLLINGYTNSGKSQIINFAISYVKQNVVILRYTCLETSTIDDMFLTFFETFKTYSQAGSIILPKIKADNFTQKINSYFNSIEIPILVVLDSFDAVLKENKAAITDFIKHLYKLKNLKIIIVSKCFDENIFTEMEYDNITILPLSQKIFEKFLKQCGIKQIGVFSNELYKLSKGYFGEVLLTVNIITLRQLTLMKFFEQFSQSYMSYSEFVIREALALIDPVSVHKIIKIFAFV